VTVHILCEDAPEDENEFDSAVASISSGPYDSDPDSILLDTLSSIDSENETMSAPAAVGAALGALLALAGTMALLRKRSSRKETGRTDSDVISSSQPWLKTLNSKESFETSSLTSGSSNSEVHFQSSGEVQFAGSENLSVTAFLSKKGAGSEPPLGTNIASPEMVPMSPANSLFSVSSSTSKKSQSLDDVVDL